MDVLLVRWIGRPTHTCTGSVSSVSQADPEQFSKSALYPDASHDYYGVGHDDASMSASRPRGVAFCATQQLRQNHEICLLF